MLPKTLSRVTPAKKTNPDAFATDYARRRTIEITTIATCPVNCTKYCPQDVLKKAYSEPSSQSRFVHLPDADRIPKGCSYGQPFVIGRHSEWRNSLSFGNA